MPEASRATKIEESVGAPRAGRTAFGISAVEKRLRIAVVGCGAIARSFHVPALVARREARDHLVLVDLDRSRAEALRDETGVGEVRTSHAEALEGLDGAIVAVPAEFHGEVTAALLRAGVPVLCEKPLAHSFQEASMLVEESHRTDTPLGVNNVRRFFPAIRAVREWIRSGRSGPLRRIEIYDGEPFEWPLASGSAFGRGGTGKGVLLDLGAHVLDMIYWWLGERPRITCYLDDSMGGSEAVARVEFEGSGYSGVVQVSWLSRLSNTFRVEAERETLTGEIRAWDRVTSIRPDGSERKVPLRPEIPSYRELKHHVIGAFLGALCEGKEMAVPGAEVLPSIEMIDECYSRRRRFPMPWHDVVEEVRNVVA